jgi:hypothetical protein
MLFKPLQRSMVLLAAFSLACAEPSTSILNTPNVISPIKQAALGPVVTDPGMGNLSSLAHQVVVGLGNPRVRMMVVEAMKNPAAAGAGLDLNDCASGSVVAQLLVAAEQRGAGSAATTCSDIGRWGGLTLYMAESGLRRWDGTFIPIVTALSARGPAVPKQWKGYRSGDRAIDLFADKPVPGPVLVVLPLTHPTRVANATRMVPLLQTHVGAFAPGITATTSGKVKDGGAK